LKRARENVLLITEIKKINETCRKTYGLPRICAHLKKMGNKLGGGDRVSRLMKQAGVCGLIKRRLVIKTTDPKQDLPIAARVLKTEEIETHPTRVNEAWASDISYVPTREGFLF